MSANVFNKSFNVINPYPEHRRIIHSLWSLPLMIFLAGLVSMFFIWKVFEYGLVLSVALLVICINLMLTEVAYEAYQNAKIFVKAFNNKADLGVGDLKAFETLKRVIPKLSNYYLVLSILFLTSAVTLVHTWSSLLLFFAQVIRLIFEASKFIVSALGLAHVPEVVALLPVFLFVLMVTAFQIFIWKIKNRFLSHLLGT
ncbi:MAG: hypothetical protein OEZ21_05540 [Candidatus Bathyarchaeota archaeon]|nr:hypothetical protein [Candidatus Bathyarchaeota archaeon]MDH5746399.1 hypothetical protein [Candidatus Bathyarchaeota archaeon]